MNINERILIRFHVFCSELLEGSCKMYGHLWGQVGLQVGGFHYMANIGSYMPCVVIGGVGRPPGRMLPLSTTFMISPVWPGEGWWGLQVGGFHFQCLVWEAHVFCGEEAGRRYPGRRFPLSNTFIDSRYLVWSGEGYGGLQVEGFYFRSLVLQAHVLCGEGRVGRSPGRRFPLSSTFIDITCLVCWGEG